MNLETLKICDNLEKVRFAKPLVHNITNYVAMNFTANALLAVGASPVMADAAEEIEDIVFLSSAVVLNIGTLNPRWVLSMKGALKAASACGKPVVLDPVGAGATAYRTAAARELLESGSIAVLRGNASEIQAVAGAADAARTRGVDSSCSSSLALEAADALAAKYGCAVSISGAKDFIRSRDGTMSLANGVELMTKVTGMGCALSALTGAFAGVCGSAFEAAYTAAAVTGIAGEMAREKTALPGSFQACFLDCLYALKPEDLERRLRITREA
ncbi:MAG TPA: hydroxyethylthiazole kinase [Elusimicrobia bacterium]|nr:hydroxyethylthiazole kinase [Elusimicrobiota bacterium]